MENHKPAESMSRTEVVFELARYAHPLHYHALLSWSTAALKALLVYYREPLKEDAPRIQSRERKLIAVCMCGREHPPEILGIEVIQFIRR